MSLVILARTMFFQSRGDYGIVNQIECSGQIVRWHIRCKLWRSSIRAMSYIPEIAIEDQSHTGLFNDEQVEMTVLVRLLYAVYHPTEQDSIPTYVQAIF